MGAPPPQLSCTPGQARLRPSRRSHCDQVKDKRPPSLVRGGALLLFPGMGSRERSGREPMPVLSIPHPMDEVHGGIFIRFAGVLVCLPMLSPFHIASP